MEFIIYSKDQCPFCNMAKQWMNMHSLTFTEKKLNDDNERKKFYESCGENVRTVPQIFVKYDNSDQFVRIGGYNELLKSDVLSKKDLNIDGDF